MSNETFNDGYVFPDEDDDFTAYTGRSAQVMVPSGLLQEICKCLCMCVLYQYFIIATTCIHIIVNIILCVPLSFE